MFHGFLRVAAAAPECSVADSGANTAEIVRLIFEAAERGAELIVFPELSVTGYTCGDLFAQEIAEKVSLAAVRHIAEKTREAPITSVVGFPLAFRNARYNCAGILSRGKIAGIVPKSFIPNYGEFYELRHFAPGPEKPILLPQGVFGIEGIPFGTNLIFCDEKMSDVSFAVEICEDLWVPDAPSQSHVLAGALCIANLSASDEIVGKSAYRRRLVCDASARGICAYVYADAGTGESSTDMVFSGHSLIAENGAILAESAPFTAGLVCADIDTARLLQERRRMNTFGAKKSSYYIEENYARVPIKLCRSPQDSSLAAQARSATDGSVIYAGDGRPTAPANASENALKIREEPPAEILLRQVPRFPFVPEGDAALSERCAEILSIQCSGLAKRLSSIGTSCAVIGISGGLDSTLALLVTARALTFWACREQAFSALQCPALAQRAAQRATRLPSRKRSARRCRK